MWIRSGTVLECRTLAQWLVVPAVVVSLALAAPTATAQSMDDAIFMDRRVICAGLVYTKEQWSQYWEGTLRRDNGNIGTVTTTHATSMVAYGLSRRLNLLAALPYVWTSTSQGVLDGQRGSQDVSIGVKYRAFSTPLTAHGTLHGIVVVSGTMPTSNYGADFLPLSIGSSANRATARGILQYAGRNGLYVNGSYAYTRRANVTLNRVSYYADGQLVRSNEVKMPDVADAALTVGYQRRRLVVPVVLTRQTTLGGGDIRRQDMPFVSNRMNFTRLDARVQYDVTRNVVVHAGGSRVLGGRNVGQSTTLMAGLLLVGKI
jgi:hypothetical protein